MSNNYPTKQGVDEAEPLTFPEIRRITISTTVQYRGRAFTVTFEGYTMDEAADLLDKRFGQPAAAPNGKEHTAAGGTPPSCPVHRREMKPMKYPSKQGHTFHCTAKVGDDGWCDERA